MLSLCSDSSLPNRVLISRRNFIGHKQSSNFLILHFRERERERASLQSEIMEQCKISGYHGIKVLHILSLILLASPPPPLFLFFLVSFPKYHCRLIMDIITDIIWSMKSKSQLQNLTNLFLCMTSFTYLNHPQVDSQCGPYILMYM